ncbi:MAG: hypothetical protein WB540_04840 [Pseudolabrys sp.]|jgi:hypothetical protein
MGRYKGRQNAKVVELDFLHFVDIVAPLGGLGTKLDAMYEFHTQYGIKPQRGHGRHDANRSVIRWCFADPEIAKSFATLFSASD